MQIGSKSPFSQPSSLADALRLPTQPKDETNNKEATKDSNASDTDENVAKKDPIDALKEQLAKESEPTAMDKLRAQIAQNGLSRLRTLVQSVQANKKQEATPSLLPHMQTQKPTEDSKAEEAKKEEEAAKDKAEDTTKPTTKPQGGLGLQISDLNRIPMTNFTATTQASYEASYNKETGVATQEMAYTQSFSFTFSGTVTDKNGKKFEIEASVTLTHSLYTKITGGSDTLDPKVMEELKKGKPFELAYEGDGKDLKDQQFGFLFDNGGKSDQITANRGIFGDLIDKAFNEGLGSLLDGLQIFAENMFGGGDKPTTIPSYAEGDQPNKKPDLFKPENLIGLGQQGVGMIFLSQMQREIFLYTSSNGSSFNASFSYQSAQMLFTTDKSNTLEAILEQQKKKKEEQNQTLSQSDVKKALNAYRSQE